MKIRSKIISDPIFMVDYYAQRGGTLQSAIDKFAKFIKVPTWEVLESNNRIGHFASHSSHKAGCIWIYDKAGTNAITHEVNHATHHLLVGLQITELAQVDELFAYYSAWLASEVVRKLF